MYNVTRVTMYAKPNIPSLFNFCSDSAFILLHFKVFFIFPWRFYSFSFIFIFYPCSFSAPYFSLFLFFILCSFSVFISAYFLLFCLHLFLFLCSFFAFSISTFSIICCCSYSVSIPVVNVLKRIQLILRLNKYKVNVRGNYGNRRRKWRGRGCYYTQWGRGGGGSQNKMRKRYLTWKHLLIY